MNAKIALATIFLCSVSGFAADTYHPMNVKLGLWETVTSQESVGALPIPPQVLERLSPEQRAKMEASLRASLGAQTRTQRHCLTQEELSKPLDWAESKDAKCKKTVVTSTSSKTEIRFTCESENMNTDGNFLFQAVDSEHVKGSGQMNMSSGGRKMNMKMNLTSKWISADCGDVKD